MRTFIRKHRFSGFIISLMSLIPLINSCEVANDLIGNATVAKLEGNWSCDENSEQFKKSTTSVYSVHIAPDADNVNGVIIDGFYNLGDIGVKASVSVLTLTIPQQTVEGGFIILNGSGVISVNYKKITWSYNINIGGDAVDHVTAVYTKVD